MSSNVLIYYAESSVHVGVGQRPGAVDLPIAREAHTGIPIWPGSGLKGAWRAWAESRGIEEVANIFGPEQGDLEQGDLVFHDAQPLAIPFRSSPGLFVWATCPLLLERIARRTSISLGTIPAVSEGEVAVISAAEGQLQNLTKLVIEELELDVTKNLQEILDLEPWGNALGSEFLGKLVVLADDDFMYLTRFFLPVLERNALSEAKTSVALWSEERLPADSIMWSLVSTVPNSARAVSRLERSWRAFHKLLQEGPLYLHVGGSETVGAGWCRVAPLGQAVREVVPSGDDAP